MLRSLLIFALPLVSMLRTLSAAEAEPTVSIAFVGDIMLVETPGALIKRGGDPFKPFAALLRTADIRVGNLECLVATSGTAEPGKTFTFRAHPRTLNVLERHFDALALANNHSGDFGPEAFREMLARLEQHHVGYFGGGRNLSAAHTPLIIERNGLRIALLGYNEFFPRSFEADTDNPGTAWSEDEQVVFDIANARSRYHVDLVIPMMHWGQEHEPLARLMIDAGADAVVGGHPHVTQDVEQYKGKPIIYSLGNFVFNGFKDGDNNTGWLLRLELDRQGVRRWQTVVAHIDRGGIPRPAYHTHGMCWSRGTEQSSACLPPQPAPSIGAARPPQRQ